MKIIFMGTPEFSVPTLEALISAGHDICAVYTQPDKPKGRGYKLVPTPVKEVALQHNIPVFQPTSFRNGENAAKVLAELKAFEPDFLVVVAYGQILPIEVLEIPKFYPINVHASLLPKYRGAAPIQRAVLDGEKVTGITTMLMEQGLDTGDMLMIVETKIGEDETSTELHNRLAKMGAELLVKTIDGVINGEITPEKQDNSLSTYAKMIDKSMSKIDFSKTATEIHNQIRGLSASPCAACFYGEKRLKIFKSTILTNETYNMEAGAVVKGKTFTVVCGDKKAVTFTEVQPEGGKRMKAEDFLRGKPVEFVN